MGVGDGLQLLPLDRRLPALVDQLPQHALADRVAIALTHDLDRRLAGPEAGEAGPLGKRGGGLPLGLGDPLDRDLDLEALGARFFASGLDHNVRGGSGHPGGESNGNRGF